MRFYGREKEIELLRRRRELSHENAQFTVVTGRRRVGKTELIDHALNDGADDYVYLLITKQSEKQLSGLLQKTAEQMLGGRLRIRGTCERVIDLVDEIMRLAEEKPLTLVIDEFQDMEKVNPAFFGEFQGLWDHFHTRTQLNLVVSGSVSRMMTRILFNAQEPLYGRCTAHLKLQPFSVSLLKTIFAEEAPGYRPEDLLALWTLTGGVARYVALLMNAQAYTLEKMLAAVFANDSIFLEEGRSLLLQEFGTEYARYFSILSAIATGHTKYAEIKNDLGDDVGTYLANLESNYFLIRKAQPIFDPDKGKNSVYRLDDCFLRFWFRYIFRNQSLVALGHYEQLRDLVQGDFATFEGYALERYFWWKFVEDTSYTKMGAWWDRKGENEIDLVCEDQFKGELDFYEVKRESERLDLDALQRKTAAFFAKNPDLKDRKIRCLGLSLADM